jgi:hypothetical protein
MARDDILLEFMNELTEYPLQKSRSAASDSSESHNDEDTSFGGGDNELDSNNDSDNDCSNTEVANFAKNNFASFHWQQPLLATRIEESAPAPVNFFHANSPLFVAGIHQVNLLPPDTAPMHLGIPQHRRENVYLGQCVITVSRKRQHRCLSSSLLGLLPSNQIGTRFLYQA